MKTTTEKFVAKVILVIVVLVSLSAIGVVFTLAGIGSWFALHHMQW